MRTEPGSTWCPDDWYDYKTRTGKDLVISPDRIGQQATVLKFLAVTGAVATHDLDPGRKRTAAGMLAFGAAIAGTVQSERARSLYKRQLRDGII